MNLSMGFWHLFGYSKVSFHSATETVHLRSNDGKDNSLLHICKSITPPCRLNPWLFNGHLQTLWTAVTKEDPPIFYKRKIFEAENLAFTGSFTADFIVSECRESDPSLPPRTCYFKDNEFQMFGSDDKTPMFVVLHGLSGGSHEAYLRQTLIPLVRENQWGGCVVNARGCANSQITSDILYNARATWDVRQIVRILRDLFPNRPLFGIGFSLGANILVNVRFLGNLYMHSNSVFLIKTSSLSVSW